MVYVLKATGEKEEFSEEKLRSSIKRAGIPDQLQNQVVTFIKGKIYDGIKTSEIYNLVLEFLGTSSSPFGRTKYSLKQAIMSLGPTGYPFEDFVAGIFKLQGYAVQVRSVLLGKCISHEVDIVAEKDQKKYMVECKFHNSVGTRSDVHVVLYTKARFDDLKDKNKFDQAILVTNTKVTSDALDYALCSNMKVMSWNYPENESLRSLVEKFNLHPITVLATLSQSQKQELLENHIIFCKEICEKPESLNLLHLPLQKIEEILKEAKFACSSYSS